ncbi:MAG TPA: tetratricopeptide repeat protein [Lachnospiraceae bacterium]|nr:tetratricopeptide repeat protein [Lachnospiraceae bacterium]
MNCYQCGCRLSPNDFCTNCGTDVSRYKKILSVSNHFYNIGLEKANVRDLSGAIGSLRQSLKLNKNNIEARNLLGLVYFEMGETILALSEWVISKNVSPKKNIADDYINAIQSNPNKLESINQTIKKYNQALSYCKQDNLDLAVIQLKKVLSLNPNYIQAHQLLALLYMNIEEWERAKLELVKCSAIDTNNTTTLRYLKEVNAMINFDEVKIQSKKKKQVDDDILKYRSGNDMIIQPINTKEPTGFSTLINIVIGVVIGLAIALFLILPARIQAAKANINKEVTEYGNLLDAKTSKIEELESNEKDLLGKIATVQQSLDEYTGTDGAMAAYEQLIKASSIYFNDTTAAMDVAECLGEIDNEYLAISSSETFQSLYDALLLEIGVNASKQYYTSGMAEYNSENYLEAIKYLLLSVKFNGADGEALLSLGNSYRLNGDKEEAIQIYTKVIELFPGTYRANKSQRYLDEYKAQ